MSVRTVLSAVLCAVMFGCSAGPSADDSGFDAQVGDGAATDIVSDRASGDTGPFDGAVVADVPSDVAPMGLGNRCSASRPCPAGTQCVDGTCALDCGGNSVCGFLQRCCGAGQLCAAGSCATPGAPCAPQPGCGAAGVGQCMRGEYCDATLMRCLPNAAIGMCTVPTMSSFRPVEAWSWRGSTAHPEYRGVLVTPVVADLDNDGASDVMVVAYRDPPIAFGGSVTAQSIVCALAGPGDCRGGARELWCTDPAIEINAWGNIAVGDLDSTDAEKHLTVIAGLRLGALGGNGIVAFDERGNRLWRGHNAMNQDVDVTVYGGGIAIADLDGNGLAEVIVGNAVFDNSGLLLWRAAGTCWGAFGPHSFAVDLSVPPDGQLEVVCGNTVYARDGRLLWTGAGIGGGWSGVADFDDDGRGDVVVVGRGEIAVFHSDGSVFVPRVAFAAFGLDGSGGTPTIADVNNDGHPDIGLAGATRYKVLSVVNRGGVWQFVSLWEQPADDASSSSTGSAMFDFDGDGQFEVIYQDTCRARVFAGRNGMVLMDIPNISGTATNYPTVADLNGDGRAEFILVSDSYYARSGLIPCPAATPRTDGVRVFRDANDNWQTTRAVWNQHAYHVTNVCDGSDTACVGIENVNGGIPRLEQVPWRMGLNGFRVNSQRGARERNAADLIVLALNADVSRCPASYTLRADIGNRGALSVPADMPVTFYLQIAGGMPMRLGTVQIGRTLLPGGTVRVELPVMPAMGGQFDVFVVPNDDGMGGHPYRECNPDNNRSEIRRVDCTLIG